MSRPRHCLTSSPFPRDDTAKRWVSLVRPLAPMRSVETGNAPIRAPGPLACWAPTDSSGPCGWVHAPGIHVLDAGRLSHPAVSPAEGEHPSVACLPAHWPRGAITGLEQSEPSGAMCSCKRQDISKKAVGINEGKKIPARRFQATRSIRGKDSADCSCPLRRGPQSATVRLWGSPAYYR